jgi:integrative and conjugative element protein (TIGR02256 family)
MINDSATPFRFVRKDPKHIKLLQHYYDKSNGYLNLVGEWHTHPEAQPTPSLTDRTNWKRIQSQRNNLETIFLILGYESIWLSTHDGDNFIRVSPNSKS